MNNKRTSTSENIKGYLGVIAWAFIHALGITGFLFLGVQWILDALDVNFNLLYYKLSAFGYIPLGLLVLIIVWIGATIYFHQTFKKPSNQNEKQ